jgi:hypothetical protein
VRDSSSPTDTLALSSTGALAAQCGRLEIGVRQTVDIFAQEIGPGDVAARGFREKARGGREPPRQWSDIDR